MKMICLGDSLTFGAGVESARCWSTLFRQESGWTVVNRGISGDTTGGMLARLRRDVLEAVHEEWGAGGSCTVLVMGGSNDIFFSGTDSLARANMAAICYQLKAEGIAPLVGIPLPVDWVGAPDKWEGVIDFRDSAAKMVEYQTWLRCFAKGAGVATVDFYRDFLDENGHIRHELYLDGVHPNWRGHEEMARRLKETLQMEKW